VVALFKQFPKRGQNENPNSENQKSKIKKRNGVAAILSPNSVSPSSAFFFTPVHRSALANEALAIGNLQSNFPFTQSLHQVSVLSGFLWSLISYFRISAFSL
jgi:hypothetical protein